MIGASFFVSNRKKLSRSIESGVIVLAGNVLVQRSGDASFSFQQEPNFWYLTGIEDAGWLLVIEGGKSWLIAPEVDEVHQIFDGSLSFSEAEKISGVDTVLTYSEGTALIQDLVKEHKKVATLGKDPRAKYYDFELNPAPVKLLRRLKKQCKEVEDCRLSLAKLRAIKQPEEIAALRNAVNLTIEAFQSTKKSLRNFSYEYEVEAEFSYHFRRSGAQGHAYDPIVAGGKNACTLHYSNNNSQLAPEQLILLDVGARIDGYPADITRTYSLSKPTARQKAVHAAVESAHKQIIALLAPGFSVTEYHEKVDEIMKEALMSLGLLEKSDDYRKYFPHAISHGLGIDVHDSLGRPETFEAGMVLTVEPGIYIPEEGIGVRIEDDILITHSGHENLSAALSTSL